MDLEKNKQRLEILAAEVEELKNSGGETVDAYTKEEADDKFATNEELEGYVSKTDADNDYIKNAAPVVVGTTNFETIPSNNDSVFLGNITSTGGNSSQVIIGNAGASYSRISGDYLVGIGSSIFIQGGNRQIAIGQGIISEGSNNIRIGDTMDGYKAITGHNNICIGTCILANDSSSRNLNNFTILGSYPDLSGMNPTRFPNGAFIVSNGTSSSKKKNLVTIFGTLNVDPNTNVSISSTGIKINNVDYYTPKIPDNEIVSGFTPTVGSTFNTGLSGTQITHGYSFKPQLNMTENIEFYYVNKDSDGTYNYVGMIPETDGYKVYTVNVTLAANSVATITGINTIPYQSTVDYFAPADETLTDGGTISATALANANKHVPLSFNAHMYYYSYEDNDNVYYNFTRLYGSTGILMNVVAINKTTGVVTIKQVSLDN